MENKICSDIGEEIIIQLKEIQDLIRKKLKEKDEKKLSTTSVSGN